MAAKQAYTEAAQIKPDSDDYPYNQIEEIDAILAEIERQKALDESYAAAIKNADQKLEINNYLEALQYYEEALEIKPGESYPSSRIAEINSRLQELEEERNKAYAAAIAQADGYYDIGNYRSAKAAYQTAVNIKSDEQYARDRLDEVTKLYAAELEALRVDYQKLIADADNYFADKIYDGAIENYRLAAALLPDEDYPGKMISRITKIINDNAITDVNKLAQIIPNNTDKRFDFPELPVNVRKQNYILIKARNLSDREFKMLVNFGVDASKTGGVVLQVPEGSDVKDYIIRIGGLYRWFSEDNNWLSIYPEGGDIEVTLVRISKSD
jgi:tetratricopeptide (TPR) repeat protein